MARISLFPEIIDAVVTGLRAETGFRAPDDTTDGVTVFDGPEFLGVRSTMVEGFLVVGYGGEDLEAREQDGQPDDAMSGDVEVRAIATSSPKQNPEDEIECVAYAWLGYVDTSAARSTAFAIADDVDTWLRANARAGVAVLADTSQVMHVQVVSRRARQWVSDGGSHCAVFFTLRAFTRT